MNSLWRQFTTFCITLWLGSFTFYAAIVVPIGTDVVGKTSQGFVTQHVARWINGCSLIVTAILIADLLRKHGLGRVLLASLFGVQTVALLVLHGKLSGYLHPQQLGVAESEVFYQWHRAYLIVSGLQWATAISIIALMVCDSAADTQKRA